MRLQRFSDEDNGTGEYLCRTYCDQSFFLRYKSCRRGRLEATGETNGGHAVDGGSR